VQEASLKVRADWRAARDRHEDEYATARRGCDAGSAADREACRDRARGQYTARMNESRTTYRRSEMRAMSDEDRREDAYEAARDKCNTLRGEAEDRCIDDARRSFYGRR
jgi:hypothetical protein